ncbi:MAG: MarC family protein [Synechococcales cyanobacterium C42_A2020_086]|jgi:multiple antibiotic resistance protein|nr:MarC family protein [Synechococcales cyanobacterium C42_A2020_086]
MDISLFIRTFIAVFVLADALGNLPIFLVLTKGMEPEERNRVVDRAAIVATSVLIAFVFLGQPILNYLHISMASLEVAGGLLLLLIALDMLKGELDTPVVQQGRDVAITPLALPLLAGPGTLTTVTLLVASDSDSIYMNYVSVVAGIVAAMLITWLIVRQSDRIDKWIGAEGATIATQLLGFLLAALAIEIGVGGLKELFLASGPLGWA